MSFTGSKRTGGKVDVEAIMVRIRAELGADDDGSATYERHGGKARTFEKEVYRDLKQAMVLGEASYGDYRIGYRTPIVGQVWAAVRERIHREIRIYADAIVARQRGYNIHLARLLNRMVESLDDLKIKDAIAVVEAQQEEIERLRKQVATLQQRLDALEGAARGHVAVEREAYASEAPEERLDR